MTDSDEPKIIVDDDWKSQVQKEKEQLEQEQAAHQEPGSDQVQIPPATLEVLISTLSAQAMAAMGLFPDPATGQPHVNREMAKHFIDLLGVLETKTTGNLTPDEDQLLTGSLHQLRMLFVSTSENNTNDDDSGRDSAENSPTIELP